MYPIAISQELRQLLLIPGLCLLLNGFKRGFAVSPVVWPLSIRARSRGKHEAATKELNPAAAKAQKMQTANLEFYGGVIALNFFLITSLIPMICLRLIGIKEIMTGRRTAVGNG